MDEIFTYDVVIIGFGKAGKTLAGQFAKGGKKVALIEKNAEMYGGTCINVGCIPSKRLINDAALSPEGDFETKAAYYQKVIAEKEQLVTALRGANYQKLVQAGVQVIDGFASFEDAHHIKVTREDQSFLVKGDQIIINTGAKPFLPPIPGLEGNPHVYTSDSLMSLPKLPKSLLIVGGGFIGLEFASLYAEFGSKVTLLQSDASFLAREDQDMADHIRAILEGQGIELILAASVKKLEGQSLYFEQDGKEMRLEGEAILLATGRTPNTQGLNCQKAGVDLSDRGAVVTDAYLRTNVDHIWAAGDVAGGLQFTYMSLDDSRIIKRAMEAMQSRTKDQRGAIAYSVFLKTPYARVGLNEGEARAKNLDFRTVSLPVSAIPKAKVLRQSQGLLKALLEPDGSILGASLLCPQAPEMINFIKLAMDQGLKAQDLADFIFTHPTMSESLNDLFSL